MNEALILLSAALILLLYLPIREKLNKIVTVGKRTIAIGSVVTICLTIVLIVTFLINLILGDNLASQVTLRYGRYTSVATVFLFILRWLTQLSFGVLIFDAFYDIKKARDFVIFAIFPITLINMCVFRFTVTSMLGDGTLYNWRAILLAIQLVTMGLLSGRRVIDLIKEKEFKTWGKRAGKALLWGACYLIAFMPTYVFSLNFGENGPVADNFNVSHRIIIYLICAVIFILYRYYNKKDDNEKWHMLSLLSVAGFIAYYAYTSFRNPLTGLPLHLCYTAITLMVICFCFRVKSVFYFNYIVNVLGALIAIIMPDAANTSFFVNDRWTFWVCHLFDFILPITASLLGVFKRPKLNELGKAVGVFFVYVCFATFMNGWLNNSPSLNPNGHEVDYFMLYGHTLTNMFTFAEPIKFNFVWTFQMGDTNVVIYWLFSLAVFGIFCCLMLLIWGMYLGLYRVEDAHRELARRRKISKVDKLGILKEMNGRPLSEPMYEEKKEMVSINNFSKVYTGTDKKAVDNINLELKEGEVWGFIGHNGAGKSTTIKSLVGIQSITEGSVIVEGYDIAKQPLEAKMKIGYVSDNHAVYEKLTGREYVYYVADLYLVEKSERDRLYDKYVTMFDMGFAMDNEIKSYSHGMKQKLMVISTLIHDPKVWVLDEPLTGLDPTSAYLIKKCMREHADRGNIVFFSSHIIDVVEKICDKIAIISKGSLCQVSTIEEIKQSGKSLEDIYLQYIDINVGEETKKAETNA